MGEIETAYWAFPVSRVNGWAGDGEGGAGAERPPVEGSGNKEARQSIAPLNRQAAYPPGTFADNKIYNLFVGAGLLPTTAALNVPGAAGRDRDLVYRIANQIFGEEGPGVPDRQPDLWGGCAWEGACPSINFSSRASKTSPGKRELMEAWGSAATVGLT